MASYELVNTRDWPRQPREDGQRDSYDIETLDLTWYPLLREQLKGSQNSGYFARNVDVTDGGSFVRSSQLQSQLSDHIDGRGRFDARELEQELKSMPRRDLVLMALKNNKIISF